MIFTIDPFLIACISERVFLFFDFCTGGFMNVSDNKFWEGITS